MGKPSNPDTTFKVEWKTSEDDLMMYYPRKTDAGLILAYLRDLTLGDYGGGKGLSILQELDRRGYDIKTLKLTIERKKADHKQTFGEAKTLKKSNGEYFRKGEKWENYYLKDEYPNDNCGG